MNAYPPVSRVVATVNCHVLQPCDMKRRHCSSFAIFMDTPAALTSRGLAREDAMSLVRLLCGAGFRKINFAGGEPTLRAWIADAEFGGTRSAIRPSARKA